MDRKGRRQSCEGVEALAQCIIDDAGARVDMVWTPASDYLVLPEELPELLPALKEARLRWAEWEIAEGKRQMLVFGAFLIGLGLFSWMGGGRPALMGPLGMAFILFMILGFVPWYQGHKRLRRAKAWVAGEAEVDLDGLRFETWLMQQKAPFTRAFAIAVGVVGLAQWLGPLSLHDQVEAAGLTKAGGRPEDWWRLATAPFLHGHPLHILFNGMALLYLSRRMEVLVRWPHAALVFVLAAWVGGECSAMWVAQPSLGASGGLMGMLGFLMVFESMHRRLVPESSRRRLLAGLLMTVAIGVIGFKFIDNAAHGGGLVAGMVYAFAMFPKSSSVFRPKDSAVDRVAGWAASGVMAAAVAWTLAKVMGWA